MTDSLELFARTLYSEAPIIAILGQQSGWGKRSPDPVLSRALKQAEREGSEWPDLLDRSPLDHSFYQWIAERFERRVPSDALSITADIPVSAIFTSSIDPGIHNLFSTNGREPETILLGKPDPAELRSFRRPPIFYLFGCAGAGTPELNPPTSRQALSQRRLQHASAMLLNVTESTTALGLIVIDGYSSKTDWLRGEDLLAAISNAPRSGVIWFGEDPNFDEDEQETFRDLVKTGIVIRDERSLGDAYATLCATNEIRPGQHLDNSDVQFPFHVR